MPSQNTQWYKDTRLIEALDQIRQRNMGFMSYCYFCGAKSTGITAVKEQLFAACDKHQDPEDLSSWMDASRGRHDITK